MYFLSIHTHYVNIYIFSLLKPLIAQQSFIPQTSLSFLCEQKKTPTTIPFYHEPFFFIIIIIYAQPPPPSPPFFKKIK